MNHSNAHALAAAAVLTMLSGLGAVHAADEYPTKPISIVLPAGPGGTTDKLGRLIGAKISQRLGQPIVLDFKPGASGMIAEETVVKAQPDGHVILMDQSSIAMTPALQKRMRFDIQKDLVPVTCLARFQHMLVVPSTLAVHTIADLVEYGKAQGGNLNYSTPGAGTPQHVLSELFLRESGITATHVPYKGGAPALLAVATGEVQLAILGVSTGQELAKAGRVRVLAVMDDARAKALPDVPTFAELGYRGMVSPWLALFVPRNTPAPVVDRLNDEFVLALRDRHVQDTLAEYGVQPLGTSSAKCATMVRDELTLNQTLVKDLGLKAD